MKLFKQVILSFSFALSLLLVSILSAPSVLAQTSALSALKNSDPAAKAKALGITFPITELGGCKDYAACHKFCDDPVNGGVCKAFFKAKGIYKEEAVEKAVTLAKGELGCVSDQSCQDFCQKSENHDKCNAFVAKHEDLGIKGGYIKDPEKLAQKAKQVLGCDSASSCKTFCEANKDKCDNFAKQVGARGGIEQKGPGGCGSEGTCKTFCSDPSNFGECSKFAPPSSGQSGPGGFKGPGGCDSESSCRSYCEKSPQDCRIVAIGGSGAIDPAKAAEEYKKFCQSNPGKCASANANPFSSNVGRTEFERFCEANPEKCGGGHEDEYKQIRKTQFENSCKNNPSGCVTGPGGYLIPREFNSQGGFVDPGDYCRRNPQSCAGGGNYNPETMCRQNPNCNWENGSCRCGFYQPTPIPIGTYAPNYSPQPGSSTQPYPNQPYPNPSNNPYTGGTSGSINNYSPVPYPTNGSYNYESAATGCKSAGGTWTGSYCQMPNSTYTNPTSAPQQTSVPAPAPTSQQTSAPTQTSAPQQTSAPAPQQISEPAPQPAQTTTTTTSSPPPQTQGVSTHRSWLQNFFQSLGF